MLRTKKKRAAHFSQLRVNIVLDATDDVSIRPLEAFPIEFGWCSMRINTLQTQSQQARYGASFHCYSPSCCRWRSPPGIRTVLDQGIAKSQFGV
jgi:hypothetical protein